MFCSTILCRGTGKRVPAAIKSLDREDGRSIGESSARNWYVDHSIDGTVSTLLHS